MPNKNSFGVFLCVGVIALSAVPAASQSYLQKYKLRGLSVVINTNNKSNTRCFEWLPFEQKAEDTPLDFRRDGMPYIDLELRGVVRPGKKCALKILSPQVLKQTSQKSDDLRFQFRVIPPATIAYLEGPDFRDEILVEAPVEKLEQKSFFEFFRNASVNFETRAGVLRTNNPAASKNSNVEVPVVGGYMAIPLPFWPSVSVGFQTFQNLGNIASSSARVQYAEFAFDLAYTFNTNINSGRPKISLVGEFRGRNIYQTSSERPFLLGSWTAPGGGYDLLWFPWTARGWNESSSHWGLESNSRLFLFSKVGARKFYSYTASLGLSYRISRKWALSGGVAEIYQAIDFSDQGVKRIIEKYDYGYLRLTLVPFVNSRATGGNN